MGRERRPVPGGRPCRRPHGLRHASSATSPRASSAVRSALAATVLPSRPGPSLVRTPYVLGPRYGRRVVRRIRHDLSYVPRTRSFGVALLQLVRHQGRSLKEDRVPGSGSPGGTSALGADYGTVPPEGGSEGGDGGLGPVGGG